MSSPNWNRFYDTAAWKRRRRHQLRLEPCCRYCLIRGRIEAATVADHVTPHNGDWNAFRLGALQSLCKPCHDGDKSFEQKHGYLRDVGLDGYPLDRRHPWYGGSPRPAKIGRYKPAGGGRGR